MVKGKKRRERPKTRWLDEVTEKKGLKLDGIFNLATNSCECVKAVHEVSRVDNDLKGDDDDDDHE